MARVLAWSLPYGIELAYSSRDDGDQRDPPRRAAFLARIGCTARCVAPGQVHGALVVDADAPADELARADGVATRDPALALAAFGADCPGLCLAAPDGLAVAHCGWRGTAAGIVAAAVAALGARSAHPPRAWRAFIGPGISGAAYEVDAPVLRARAWPEAALSHRRGERAHLDLATAIGCDLAAAGIAAVTRAAACTASDPDLWSYRRRGPGIVQALVAWRRPATSAGPG